MQTNQTEAQQMAAALLAYLNQLEILPVNIALERAEERPAAVMTLREEPAYRRYDLAGGYKAVSYTHLDVYKRQQYNCWKKTASL